MRSGEMFRDDGLHHDTIAHKLRSVASGAQYERFKVCGQEVLFRVCQGCGKSRQVSTRCNLKWCPVCNWRLTDARKKVLQVWASKVAAPKHLVLTQKNIPILTRQVLRNVQKSLVRMRRSKCFGQVAGGCVSIEITNEAAGWHPHSHWLLDAPWLDMSEISKTWAGIVGQQFAICKIKSVEGESYVNEVCKYVVEGSAMAQWPAEIIWEFICAVKGRRFFFTFGNLFKAGSDIRKELKGGYEKTNSLSVRL